MKFLIKQLLREGVNNVNLPFIKLNKVYHVGSLDIKRKSSSSYEGSGLSVSLNPKEWQKINPMTQGDLFELSKNGGLFIDKHNINKKQQQFIVQWGVVNKYVIQQVTYRYHYYDDEFEQEVYQEFNSLEQAKHEAGDGDIRPFKKGLKPTNKLKNETRQSTIGPSSTFDFLLTLYVEKETKFDGVWWNDELDVLKYSAPRGVIFNSKIKTWNVNKIN